MTTLHIICGLPGSGKTTLAKRLENELPALRLCPDEWMERIVGDGHNEPMRNAIESTQWKVAERVLVLGVDVILENGFWAREERYEYRSRAESLGVELEIHFLDVPKDELLRRLEARNSALPPDTFHVTKEELISWWNVFEPPTHDELASTSSQTRN